jgi:ubiquinone/menaquinone biosynthesis C-methylase UbiE
MSKAFQDHFSGIASRYATFRPRYPAALYDYLASLVPQSAVVWDCAAGTGQASVDLARRFRRVIATDASAEQIAAATPHPRVEYRVASAEESGLAFGSVDVITVAQALHWFDLDRFCREAKRVLAPGGLLAVWAYGIHEVEGGKINQLVSNFYSNVVGPYWPPERRLVEEGYQGIPFPFAELEPPLFQMETRWTLDQLLGYLGTWSATNRYIEATGRNPMESLATELLRMWPEPDSTRLIVWPLNLRVGRKLGGPGLAGGGSGAAA